MFGIGGLARIWGRDRDNSEFWDSHDRPRRERIDLDLWRALPPSPNEEVPVRVRVDGGPVQNARMRIGDLPEGYHFGMIIEIEQ